MQQFMAIGMNHGSFFLALGMRGLYSLVTKRGVESGGLYRV